MRSQRLDITHLSTAGDIKRDQIPLTLEAQKASEVRMRKPPVPKREHWSLTQRYFCHVFVTSHFSAVTCIEFVY